MKQSLGAFAASVVLLSLSVSACTTTGTSVRDAQPANERAAEINMQLGLSYLQRGDFAIALEKLEKSLQQNPRLPATHNTIALLYQAIGEQDKALRHFQQAVALDADYSEAQNNYAVFLCERGDYAEAERGFLRALENPLYPSPELALENAGLCAQRAGDDAAAEQYFRRALQIQPQLGGALIAMARLRLAQGQPLQARGYVQRFERVAQWSPSALRTAIDTEEQLGDSEAVSSYRMILKARFPDSDEWQSIQRQVP